VISLDRINGFGRVRQHMSQPAVRRAAAVIAAIAIAALPNVSPAQLAVDHVEAILRPNARSEREVVIGVRNEGDKAVQAVVRLEDWERGSDGTNSWSAIGTRPGSCGKALTVFPLTMSLEPGASQSVRVVLDSTFATTSECWAGAVVETVQPVTRQNGQQVGYVLRTAVKLYVQPVGLQVDGDITDLRVLGDSTSATPDSSRRVMVEFENTGMRHVVAQGGIEFRRADNSVAARIPLPNVYALPGARQFVVTALPKLEPGKYVMLATYDFGGTEIAAAQIEYEVVR
jgi:P pilus assembly chaperone PapD